jgi:hypothetical protein
MMEHLDNRAWITKLWTGLAVLLIPLFVWIYWVAEESPGLHDVVAIDHALVARSIVEGRGLTSAVVTPLHARFEGGIDKAEPVFAKPALALWQALWFNLSGDSRNTVIISSGVFFILTAWLVFILAARFHSSATAWVCFLVFVLNPYVLDLSTSGRPEPMGMFFVGLLFLILSRDPPEPGTFWIPWSACFWSGVAAGGLMQCIPHVTLPLVVLLPLYWYRWSFRSSVATPLETGPEGQVDHLVAGTWLAKGLGVCLLGVGMIGLFLPALLIELGRLVVDGPAPVSVSRFLIAVNSSVALGWSFWREFPLVEPSALSFVSMYTPSVSLKWVAGLSFGFTMMFDVFQPLVCALFILALFFPEHGEGHGFRWWLLMMIALHVAGMALYYWDSRFIAVWTPMVVVTGIGTFSEFLQQRYLLQQRARMAAVPLHMQHLKDVLLLYYTPMALLLVFTTGMLFLRLWDRTPPDRLRSTASMAAMQQDPSRYQHIVTPAPWMVAWHTGARTLWMPENESTMSQMEKEFGPFMRTVYLPRNRAEILHDRVPSWWFHALRQPQMFPAYESAAFADFGEAVYLRRTTEVDQ